MDVIGVLDLRKGLAVHAVSGEREHYAPARMATHPEIAPGDALGIGNAYLSTCGLTELYVADLDAIIERHPQAALVRAIARLNATLWLDAGSRSEEEAGVAIENGAHRIVIGLETLPSFDTLTSIVGAVGTDRIVFSVDLRDRQPIAPSTRLAAYRPEDLVRAAADAGVTTVIVLDLARVGTGRGPDLDLIERVRGATPDITLLAGGGVRRIDDLIQLEQAGCNGVLVATALLSGRLTARAIRSLHSRRRAQPSI